MGVGTFSNDSDIDLTPIANAETESSNIIVPKKDNEAEIEMVEKIVRSYFKDNPILSNIAWCESRFRHYDADGNIHRGEVNNRDVGVMQINERFHLNQALKFGYDIYTLKGNMAYAKYLYDKEGSVPWNSSSKCWKKKEIAQK